MDDRHGAITFVVALIVVSIALELGLFSAHLFYRSLTFTHFQMYSRSAIVSPKAMCGSYESESET